MSGVRPRSSRAAVARATTCRRARLAFASAAVPALLVALATTAFAHTGFSPDEAAPGSAIALTLAVADERDDAATTTVELFFPEGMTFAITEIQTPPGWTATPAADRVTFAGSAVDGDLDLRFVLGPMPAEPQRLQFKVLQTYENGEIDRWIEEWPEGAPEPEKPGPILTVVEGAPGTVPPPTTAAPTTVAPDPTTTVADDPVVAPESTTTQPATTTTGADEGDGDGDSDTNVGGFVAIAVALLVLGGAATALARRGRGSPSE